MFDADRLRELLAARQMSQGELARRIGISQQTISRLASGERYGSRHLHRIARELGTTPAYLEGEIDDPDEGAAPPPSAPRFRHVMMPVALPSEAALAEMYEAQLKALGRLEGAELARALAKRLPRALARLQGAELYEETDDAPEASGGAQPQPTDHREPRRVQRT